MDDPYSPPWLTYEYSEPRLVIKYTYAKAFSLNPRYQNDTDALPYSPGLQEGILRYSSA
jgi:hypothetical protein